MVRAIWNDTVIADSDETVVVEGNHYFPPHSVNRDHLRECTATTFCGWKGTAHYYDVVVDGQVNPGAAWHYPEPMDAASHLQHRIAFWKGVEVTED